MHQRYDTSGRILCHTAEGALMWGSSHGVSKRPLMSQHVHRVPLIILMLLGGPYGNCQAASPAERMLMQLNLGAGSPAAPCTRAELLCSGSLMPA